jgi:hypothetical protein
MGHRIQRGQRVAESLGLAIQRFTIEHAHRFVFAAQKDQYVPATRPQIEDAVAFRHEAEQWERWPDEQAKAERDLQGS